MMRTSFLHSVIGFSLLTGLLVSDLCSETVLAQTAMTGAHPSIKNDLTSDPLDPVVELHRIRARRSLPDTRPSLFGTSPLTPLRQSWLELEKQVYEETDMKFGTAFNHLFQRMDESLPDRDKFGMSTYMSIVGTWEVCNKGCPDQGEITIGLEGRWAYGTTAPTDLANLGLGSLTFSANPFTEYNPAILIRNLFWRQGGREAGWVYRVGKITPDQLFLTSAHLNPLATFHSITGTGTFSNGLADSGLGIAAGWFVNDRVTLAGAVTDANANRNDFGDIGKGDFYKAVELQVKICPLTKNAGYSKVTFWHNDGTFDGQPINGSTGNDGWGVAMKHEQELTCDGRAVAILRWGKSFDKSALYDDLAAAQLILYDPFETGYYDSDIIHADAVGVGYSWAQPSAAGTRDESNYELFYRFPLFPLTDLTLSYQAIVNPALDPTNDYGSVFGARFRSTF